MRPMEKVGRAGSGALFRFPPIDREPGTVRSLTAYKSVFSVSWQSSRTAEQASCDGF